MEQPIVTHFTAYIIVMYATLCMLYEKSTLFGVISLMFLWESSAMRLSLFKVPIGYTVYTNTLYKVCGLHYRSILRVSFASFRWRALKSGTFYTINNLFNLSSARRWPNNQVQSNINVYFISLLLQVVATRLHYDWVF